MMDLDEELTLRIKTVFENYDDGESDLGWAQLRTKYPKESTPKFPLYWVMGAVACLLVVFGLWFLKNPVSTPEKTQVITGKKQEAKPATEPTVPQRELATATTTAKTEKNTNHNVKRLNVPLGEVKEKSEKQNNAIAINQNQQKKVKQDVNPLNIAAVQQDVPTSKQVENPKIINDQFIAQTPSNTKQIDTLPGVKDQLAVEKKEVKKIDEPLVKKKTTEEFLKEQTKLATAKLNKKEKTSNNSKNSYEVFTGTFLNYYGDNDVAVNAGFGLNANLKVSKGIFLSVGAGVSQNKLSYHNYVPRANGLQEDIASNPTSFSSLTAIQASSTATTIQLHAQLISLDLPITMKFYPTKKQNFYFSTGFNSNSYFAQRYNYNYTVITTSSSYLNSKYEREETEKEKFKGFDFANSAIFAIGINQRLGKTNSLIFEPYFKPAIGNMGDKNLRINTVGLNLKFSFNETDKK